LKKLLLISNVYAEVTKSTQFCYSGMILLRSIRFERSMCKQGQRAGKYCSS